MLATHGWWGVARRREDGSSSAGHPLTLRANRPVDGDVPNLMHLGESGYLRAADTFFATLFLAVVAVLLTAAPALLAASPRPTPWWSDLRSWHRPPGTRRRERRLEPKASKLGFGHADPVVAGRPGHCEIVRRRSGVPMRRCTGARRPPAADETRLRERLVYSHFGVSPLRALRSHMAVVSNAGARLLRVSADPHGGAGARHARCSAGLRGPDAGRRVRVSSDGVWSKS